MHYCSIFRIAFIGFIFIFILLDTDVGHVNAVNPKEFTPIRVSCPERCTCRHLHPGKDSELINVECGYEGFTTLAVDMPNVTAQLDLRGNRITELHENSFAGLGRLKYLNIRANNISIMSVNTFVGLTQLRTLVLSENRRLSAGLVDFVFSPLTSLRDLHLVRCGLKSVNVKSFLNLTNLVTLDLSGNLLVVFPDFEYMNIPVLPELRTMIIDANSIKSIDYNNVFKLNNLSILNINGNYIDDICLPQSYFVKNENNASSTDVKSAYVKSNFNKLVGSEFQFDVKLNNSYKAPVGLKTFVSSKNTIRVLTANCFAALNSIEILILAGNLITKIDALAFNQLSNLKHLSLTGNLITIYENRVFSPATSLEYCDISRGKITSLNVNAFLNLNYLSIVNLDSNNLTNIPQLGNESFPTLLNLKRLSLADNNIASFDDNAESMISYGNAHTENRLSELNLDHNVIVNLTAGNYFKRFPRLTKLSIKSNKINAIYPTTSTELMSLRSLDLSNNPIKILRDGALSTLRLLVFLDLTHCQLNNVNIKAFVNLSRLTDLRLSFNNLSDIPNFSHPRNVSILPNLTSLSMANHNSFSLKSVTGLLSLPNLQTLKLDGNTLRIPVGILEKLPRLKRLSLIKCKVSLIKSGLRSSSLTHLDLTDSFITTNQYNAFEESQMLIKLDMANCQQDKQAPKNQKFRNLTQLEHIDLANTGIIPQLDSFENSANIKYLNLNGNLLGKLHSNIFKQMTKLESLHLSNTGLNSINYSSLPELLWTELNEIDLSKNSFICDCGIVWFRKWLKTTNVTILNSKEYKCDFPLDYKGTHIKELSQPTDIECFMPPSDWLIVFVFVFIFLVFFASLPVALLYRFRWHVRYWQSIVMTRRRQCKESVDQRQYDYDAFVMYCQQDSQWVINELRPHLEIEANLRLCIHHRDWLGGRDITDNITESIENSRKCLLIVSNAFAASQWCHVELTMAQSRLFKEDRDNLVLVLLEEISDCHVTPRLRLQMQRKTYIEWTDNIVGQQLFWARLGRALKGPSQSVTNAPIPLKVFKEVKYDDE